MNPELVKQAWAYFNDVQTKDMKYQQLMGPNDQPPTYLNKETMEQFRPEMKKFYYDPTRYKTCLEQLGIQYPTVKPEDVAKPGQ